MRLSKLFVKAQKEAPKDETSVNARLLVQAGYVYKVMAGVYAYLPFGLRVLNKIRNIIREEMNAIGGQEVWMPSLHPSELWKTTGAWDGVDILFKLKSRTGKDYALAQSHEELVTPIAKEHTLSYKDLPLAVYHISPKFRDELRAKSGILRGREFEMKDMYSFHETQEDFERFYDEVKNAYLRAYSRAGLVAKVTEASGGSFSEKISYEFMVLTDAGEDDIFYCENCEYCVNAEIAKEKEGDTCGKCGNGKLVKGRASEVGNVFDLGTKYSKDFGFTFLGKDGEKKHPIMGCYGWGTTRTMGVIAEKFSDAKGLIWPVSVAPYHAIIIPIVSKDESVNDKINKISEGFYQDLHEAGIEVIYDDRGEKSAGEKFAYADLLGIPWRIVLSEKTLKEDKAEIKKRDGERPELAGKKEVIIRILKELGK
jgi:prolyl-tRNA synthetase